MDRLLLIDAHAIIHRAYHALPPLTNSKGVQIGAVYGFVSMLLRVIQNLAPTHLAVAFDRPKPTFRKTLFADYQAHRPLMADDLVPQIALVHKFVDDLGIPIFEMDGFEADDVMGTIATKIKNQKSKIKITDKNSKLPEKIEVIIVTGDRDILQLVNDRVKVFMPVNGLAEGKLYGEKEVEEKFGIKASQVVDYKALVGDASDNYPGVPGIGPKTASGLLVRFHTLENLYAHLDRIENEGTRDKLKANKESAEMAKKLATIVCDVSLELDITHCKLPELDRPHIYAIFEELGFRSLIPRLPSGNKKQETENTKRKIIEKKDTETHSGQTTLF